MKKDTKFKAGNSGKPKGAISEKTKFWNQLKDWMTEDGADKFKVEMERLEGKDYIQAYNQALEYFKPKLARTDSKITQVTKLITVVPPGEKKPRVEEE
jgi:hypothetical protein